MFLEPTEKIKISAIDDQLIFRELLSRALRSIPEFDFLEAYSDGNMFIESISANPALKPHIAIIDMDMPKMSGEELNKILQEKYSEVKVIVLSMHTDASTITNIINSGAASYLLKDSPISELLWAINSVYRTGFYLNNLIVDKLREGKERKSPAINGISPREIEVLDLICKEYTNSEIAEKLNISIRTVDTHRKSLLTKTESRNTAGLVLFAVKNRLLEC
ncbi:response regulator [Desertivirga brevis]|uniref:response regulator n=1 Tax=Desertivirga brevis TaxID=2810310 RepID=UPI001A9792BD|nr:response regulator transcription factor [Pedobacter sp. SYSU D00873]